MLPIEEATLLELRLKWLHMRMFTNEIPYLLDPTVTITTVVTASMDVGVVVPNRLWWN